MSLVVLNLSEEDRGGSLCRLFDKQPDCSCPCRSATVIKSSVSSEGFGDSLYNTQSRWCGYCLGRSGRTPSLSWASVGGATAPLPGCRTFSASPNSFPVNHGPRPCRGTACCHETPLGVGPCVRSGHACDRIGAPVMAVFVSKADCKRQSKSGTYQPGNSRREPSVAKSVTACRIRCGR